MEAGSDSEIRIFKYLDRSSPCRIKKERERRLTKTLATAREKGHIGKKRKGKGG